MSTLTFNRPHQTKSGIRTRVFRRLLEEPFYLLLGTVWKHGTSHWIWETVDGNWDGCEETRLKAADKLDEAWAEGWTKRDGSFETVALILDSQFAIEAVVERLIHNSQWFAVMPLPDDKWEITTKIGVDLAK